MVELKDTVALMTSADYKERFQAEYYQLETRFIKLKTMCDKWDKGELDFTPTCDRVLYDTQLKCMVRYLNILITRAEIENVKINVSPIVETFYVKQ